MWPEEEILHRGDRSGKRSNRVGSPRARRRVFTQVLAAVAVSESKIVAVAMDMSAAYWKAVRENLREAAIVFDKFHIVKLVNEKLDELRRDLVRQAEGLLHTSIKGLRYLLLTRRDHLPDDKMQTLDEALNSISRCSPLTI